MNLNKTFFGSCVLLIVTILIVQMIRAESNVVVVDKNLYSLPYEIGGYTGSDLEMEEAVIKELNTDIYLFRNYSKVEGDEVVLYVGYYGTRKGGRTGHTPLACYPAAGWSILKETEVEIPVSFNGHEKKLTLNFLKVKNGDTLQLVYYWYQSSDKILSSNIYRNLDRAKTKLFKNRNDGAFIRISIIVRKSDEIAVDKLNYFFKELYPLIIQHWPVEEVI